VDGSLRVCKIKNRHVALSRPCQCAAEQSEELLPANWGGMSCRRCVLRWKLRSRSSPRLTTARSCHRRTFGRPPYGRAYRRRSDARRPRSPGCVASGNRAPSRLLLLDRRPRRLQVGGDAQLARGADVLWQDARGSPRLVAGVVDGPGDRGWPVSRLNGSAAAWRRSSSPRR
jgi:hypothetical protein